MAYRVVTLDKLIDQWERLPGIGHKTAVRLAFAVATVYMVPTLLLFLYGEDYLVEGIAYAGGIKG